MACLLEATQFVERTICNIRQLPAIFWGRELDVFGKLVSWVLVTDLHIDYHHLCFMGEHIRTQKGKSFTCPRSRGLYLEEKGLESRSF